MKIISIKVELSISDAAEASKRIAEACMSVLGRREAGPC